MEDTLTLADGTVVTLDEAMQLAALCAELAEITEAMIVGMSAFVQAVTTFMQNIAAWAQTNPPIRAAFWRKGFHIGPRPLTLALTATRPRRHQRKRRKAWR